VIGRALTTQTVPTIPQDSHDPTKDQIRLIAGVHLKQVATVVWGRRSPTELVAVLALPQPMLPDAHGEPRVPFALLAAGDTEPVLRLLEWLVFPSDEGEPVGKKPPTTPPPPVDVEVFRAALLAGHDALAAHGIHFSPAAVAVWDEKQRAAVRSNY
jgi:hypothetical protein